MANNYSEAIEKAKKDIIDLKGNLDGLHKSILENAKEFNKIFKGGDTNIKTVKLQLELVQKQMKLLTEEKRKAILVERELQSKIKTQNDLLRLEHNQIKKNITVKKEEERQAKLQTIAKEKERKATERQTKANIEASRPYSKLIAQHKQAKRILQDLIVAKGKDNNATRQAQKHYDLLSKKVNQANSATQNFAKGGLRNSVRGVRNLLGAFGIIGGFQLFADLVKSVFSLTKELDSLNFTMRTIIKTNFDLESTQRFLLKITKDYGVELVSTTKRYLKFLAAAEQSGISLATTENIFRSVTKAASTLGLKTDELTGVYLALEQMLSKGKVTTEELRRQLGERLPGAMGVMAAALGVTIPKLEEMLKKGEVMSADALPKFAKALEVAFGIKQVENIDNLVASQNRLSNSWNIFIKNITDGDGAISRFFKSAIEGLNDFVELMGKISSDDKINLQSEIIEQTKTVQAVLKLEADLILKEQGIFVKDYTKNILDARIKLINLTGDKKAYAEQEKILRDFVKLQLDQDELIEQSKVSAAEQNIKSASKEYLEKKKLYEDEVKILNELESKTFIGNRGQNKAYARNAINIDKQKEKLKELATEYAYATAAFDVYRKLLQKDLPVPVEPDEEKGGSGRKNKEKDFNLERYWVERRMALNKEIIEDERNTFEARKNALEEYRKDSKLLNEIIFNEEIKKANESNINKAKLTKKAIQDNLDRTSEYGKKLNELENHIYKDNFNITKKYVEKELAELENQKNKELIIAGKNIKKRKDIEEKYRVLSLKAQLSIYSQTLKNTELFTDEQIELFSKMMNKIEAEIEKGLNSSKIKLESYKEIFATVTETFADVFDIDISKFDFLFDHLENTLTDWANLSKELIGSVLDASMQRYEIELQEAQRARDEILNNDLSTEEARENARRKFDEKERDIRTRKAKQERENTLIKIAVDTASAIVQSLPNIPLSIAVASLGLAQAAFVNSLPLPQFFKGVENSSYEGWATKDEKGAEIQFDKKGNIKDFGQGGGAKTTYVEKGDTILTAQKTKSFLDGFDLNNIDKAVFDMNMHSNGEILQKNEVDKSLLNEVRSLHKSNDRVWNEVKKLANRPINVKNKVELKDNRPY